MKDKYSLVLCVFLEWPAQKISLFCRPHMPDAPRFLLSSAWAAMVVLRENGALPERVPFDKEVLKTRSDWLRARRLVSHNMAKRAAPRHYSLVHFFLSLGKNEKFFRTKVVPAYLLHEFLGRVGE